MYKSTIFILIFILVISNCFSQKYNYKDNIGSNGLHVLESKSDLIKLGFAIDAFELKEIIVEEIQMTKINWGNSFLPGKEGFPELPSITKNIVIPNDAQINLEFISKSQDQINHLIIHPVAKTPGELQKPFIAKRGVCYLEDEFYPKSPIQISYTEIRGLKIARISIIPFQYNPVKQELVINKNIDIELNISSKSNEYGEDRYRSTYWDQILADVIFNFEALPPIDYYASKSPDEDGCELLIICPNNTEFTNWADTIKLFRNEQGISTKIITTEQMGGNDTTSIKQFIRNAYESWNPVPSAILILGDHQIDDSGILSRVYNDHPEDGFYVGDNYYVDLTDNELPDIVLGRIPARDHEELKIMIKKYINYELSPPLEHSYYHTPLMGCGYQTNRWFQMCTESISGYMRQALGKEPLRVDEFIYWEDPPDPNTDPWSTAANSDLPINYFGTNGLNYIPYAPVNCGPWGEGSADDIIAQLELGSFATIIRDHGWNLGYSAPNFHVRDLEKLDNSDFPTFLFSIACYNGAFNYYEYSIIEELLLHSKGGIYGGMAATTWSWSFYNDCILWGTIDNLWQGFLPDYGNNNIPHREFKPAFGLASGKYYMNNSNWISGDTLKRITNRIWTYFGDPFTNVYTSAPMNNPVQHPFSLDDTSHSMEIEAEPLSLVCLSIDGEIIAKSFTNDVGKAILEFTPQEIHTKFKIVVTKQNYFRYEEDIYVIPEHGPYLVLKEMHRVDENNNGQLEYNETLSLDIRLRNYGHDASEKIKIVFSGEEEYYQFKTELDYTLCEIPANHEKRLYNVIEFQTDIDIPDQYCFNIYYQSEDTSIIPNNFLSFQANAPKFHFLPMEITEIKGNDDHYPDPGETLSIELNCINIGHATYPESKFGIQISSPFISTMLNDSIIPEVPAIDTMKIIYQMEIPQSIDSLSIFQCIHHWESSTIPLTNEQYFFTGKITEDFETGDLEKLNWYLEGDKDWEVNNSYSEDGEYSVQINNLDDNQKASLNLDYFFGGDFEISFFIQMITEEDFDLLSFYVNDSLIQSWSGFSLFDFNSKQNIMIPKGQNKLTWEYSKNDDISYGMDAVWLDRIILPPIDSISGLGLQEIENKNYINISPKPSNGDITISNNHSFTIEYFEITGINGQLLRRNHNKILPYSETSIHLNDLNSGCYIIRFISSNDEIIIDKLIIN